MALPLIDPLVGFALMLAAFILGLVAGVRLISNSHNSNRMNRY
jgi:hypothetical protein